MSFLFGGRRAPKIQTDADAMHDALIAVTRRPSFFLDDGVPDTFEGRFDLLVLLASVLLRRLRAFDEEGREAAQCVVDTLFRRLDIAMRELGVSDVGVPKRMKRLAEAFKGRTAVYDRALIDRDEPALASAIGRNVLDGKADGHHLARFILEAEGRFGSSGFDVLRQGILPFPPAEAPAPVTAR